MAKKYLKLQAAAKRLGITPDQLAKEREAGAVRGFANRGSWKFREEDIDEFARTRETDSSPEIPLKAPDLEKESEADMMDLMDTSDSDVKLYSKSSLFDDDDTADLSGSDSDVRLAGDSGPSLESDDSSPSGEKVLEFDDSDKSLTDSDSDVKMVGTGTDPDINLADDSDLKLIDPLQTDADEDRDNTLSSPDDDSGISLDIDDSGISLEADDSGISLEGVESSFAADSGISLDSGDSGISLDSGDSGISLDSGDSGISLEADQDSGISIEVDDSGITKAIDPASGDAGAETLQMDLKGSESEFDLGLLDTDEQDTGTDTSILMFDDDGVSTDTDFSAVDGDEDDFDDDMDDVFEADDEEEFESGESQVEFVAPVGSAARAVEASWGTGVTLGVVSGSVFSVVGAFAGFELVRTMWMWFQPGSGESGFLNFLGGLFV